MAASAADGTVARVAAHMVEAFLRPNGLHGACYYSALALRHRLSAVYGLEVDCVAGFVRLRDTAWASHAWIEHGGRRTDVSLHFPNPPLPPGPLVIAGRTVRNGVPYEYSLSPQDGTVLLDVPGPQQARRRAEHAMFLELASGPLDAVNGYLSLAPNNLYAHLQKAWASFLA